jgi:hypothetical protein
LTSRTANPRRPAPPTDTKGVHVTAVIAFVVSLGLLALASRQLAAAGRALGMPTTLVSLLESLALG